MNRSSSSGKEPCARQKCSCTVLYGPSTLSGNNSSSAKGMDNSLVPEFNFWQLTKPLPYTVLPGCTAVLVDAAVALLQ